MDIYEFNISIWEHSGEFHYGIYQTFRAYEDDDFEFIESGSADTQEEVIEMAMEGARRVFAQVQTDSSAN